MAEEGLTVVGVDFGGVLNLVMIAAESATPGMSSECCDEGWRS